MITHARNLLLAALLAAVAALGAAAPAGAEVPARPFLFSIEEPGGPLNGACGATVDSSGDIYVADYFHHAIDILRMDNPQPTPPAAPKEVPLPLTRISNVDPDNGPCALAVDSHGTLYVNSYHQGVVKYTPNVYPFSLPASFVVPTYSGPVTVDSGNVAGIAVDPASDDLYVSHRTYVAAYDPAGAPVLDGAQPLKIGLGTLGDAYGLAVSGFPATAGRVYVADASDETVKAYDPAIDPEAPAEVIDGSQGPRGSFNDLVDSDLAVDNANGIFFVVDNLEPGVTRAAAAVYEFGASGGYRSQLPRPILQAEPSGIAVDNSTGPLKSADSGHVYVTSGSGEGAALFSFGLPFPSATLRVTPAGAGAGTVISDPAGVNCGSACAAEFRSNKTVTLSATPDSHSVFKGWSVAGQPGACPGTGPCQLTLAADAEVAAEFEALPQQALSLAKAGAGQGTVASSPAEIDCGPACSAQAGEFTTGSVATLSATPDSHSAFKGWSVAGQPGACPGTGPCQLTLSADAEVAAEFEALPQRTLSVQKAGAGQGTVASAPAGIDCGSACATTANQGAQLTLSATPAPGQRFAGWSGAGCTGTGPCQVTLSADATATARFEPISQSLALTVSGQGAVSSQPAGIACRSACAASFNQGTQVTLSADPAPGWRLAGWSGGGCAGHRGCQLTLGADASVTATFLPAEHALSVSLAGSGQGAVTSDVGIDCGHACAAVLRDGTQATLTAAPAPGSTFTGWGGCPRPQGNRCSLQVGGEETVSASFAEAASLQLTGLTQHGAKAELELEVSAAGRLTATAKQLAPAQLRPQQAGTLSLPLSLNRAARAKLARKGKLAVKATLSFTPADGGAAATLVKTVTFQEPKQKKGSNR